MEATRHQDLGMGAIHSAAIPMTASIAVVKSAVLIEVNNGSLTSLR